MTNETGINTHLWQYTNFQGFLVMRQLIGFVVQCSEYRVYVNTVVVGLKLIDLSIN